MAFSNDIKVFLRSWGRHFALQFSTTVVLTATFTIVGFMINVSFNLKKVLATWGEQVQIAIYLEDEISDRALEALRGYLSANPMVAGVQYTTRQRAAEVFRDQMASYAPDLLGDAEFATPFPASLQVHLKSDSRDASQAEVRVKEIEELAKAIGSQEGVEDVSYGQSWVKSYASFVAVVQGAGIAVGLILLLGSLFVVGNSIRSLIASRREEIEILELVGAAKRHVRRPFITEGALLGLIASVLALIANAVLYYWQLGVMRKSLAFARMATEFEFLSSFNIVLFVAVAMAIGALGSWFSIRSLNDGWAAARGAGARA